jgi:hypothetical protein
MEGLNVKVYHRTNTGWSPEGRAIYEIPDESFYSKYVKPKYHLGTKREIVGGYFEGESTIIEDVRFEMTSERYEYRTTRGWLMEGLLS